MDKPPRKVDGHDSVGFIMKWLSKVHVKESCIDMEIEPSWNVIFWNVGPGGGGGGGISASRLQPICPQ